MEGGRAWTRASSRWGRGAKGTIEMASIASGVDGVRDGCWCERSDALGSRGELSRVPKRRVGSLVHKRPGDRRHPRRARDCGPDEAFACIFFHVRQLRARCDAPARRVAVVALAHVIQQRADEGSDTSFPADRKKNLSHLITRIAEVTTACV